MNNKEATIYIKNIDIEKPNDFDTCLVNTYGYWRELTWRELLGKRSGFYNDIDIKQSSKHKTWFLAPAIPDGE